MKKYLIITILLAFLLLFSSCGDKNGAGEDVSGESESVSENAGQTEEKETTAPTTKPGEKEDAHPSSSSHDEESTEPSTEEKTTAESVKKTAGVYYGKKGGDVITDSGYAPLQKVKLKVSPDTDYSEYSKTLIEHGFGAAKDGVASPVSQLNQQFMDEHGFDSLCWDNKTDEKVIYLTFDVGYENGYTEKVLDILKDKKVTAAFFVTVPEMEENPDIIARMIKEGHIVGNHSTSHPNFTKLSQDEIVSQLQGFDDYARENFGYSPRFFRYPEGKYSEFTEKTITDLGFTSVFWSLAYEDWNLSAQPSEKEAYNTVVSRLHKGAVILLHAVSPVNSKILPDVIDEARRQGYEFRTLSDYLESR